ncbi:hypothetical protein [Leptospira alstonii]|uniref:Uncharacterized protein n=2 Tax=Leptospira alstonii TaxID=28452 RepID=M6CYV6_9LEPT|nr:hypothetical protein [Leptospira alstonii]EMJ94118.1 hypothetical protein LEP1GSC194_0158 [Leptospira alstonii serovar Sichuan str. 79601]EQA79199.1 hypothetical protein LEP1GSC193_2702 [Leptospira alstonii serovar Pingchang str. 80-412]
MSNLEIADMPLCIGMEYEVIKSFDTFQQSKRYTYVGYNALYDDRSVAGYEHFFHDAENDKLHGWRTSNDRIKKETVSFFNRVGGWEKPVSNSITPIDLNRFDLSQILQSYVPYFKSLIAGEKNIRNWYEWWEENEKLLEKIFSRGEYLRWKIYPIQEVEKFLRESNIPFQRGYRYLWIDSDRLKYYFNM